jgi:hypothetical protein
MQTNIGILNRYSSTDAAINQKGFENTISFEKHFQVNSKTMAGKISKFSACFASFQDFASMQMFLFFV